MTCAGEGARLPARVPMAVSLVMEDTDERTVENPTNMDGGAARADASEAPPTTPAPGTATQGLALGTAADSTYARRERRSAAEALASTRMVAAAAILESERTNNGSLEAFEAFLPLVIAGTPEGAKPSRTPGGVEASVASAPPTPQTLALAPVPPSDEGAQPQGTLVDVASSTPLRQQWASYASERILDKWGRHRDRGAAGLALRSWYVQIPSVLRMIESSSEALADPSSRDPIFFKADTYNELVYGVRLRKHEALRTWRLLVEGRKLKANVVRDQRLAALQRRAMRAWLLYVEASHAKAISARRSMHQRIKVQGRLRWDVFMHWRVYVAYVKFLKAQGARLGYRRLQRIKARAFMHWHAMACSNVFERKRKDIMVQCNWKWFVKYTTLVKDTEKEFNRLNKECDRLYAWEKSTCDELKTAAEALEAGEEGRKTLARDLEAANLKILESKREGRQQAMETVRSWLPSLAKRVSKLSITYFNFKNSVRNEFEVSTHEIVCLFKVSIEKMLSHEKQLVEKSKYNRVMHEKDVYLISSMLTTDDGQKSLSDLKTEKPLSESVEAILYQIGSLKEHKEDADASLQAKQLQLDIAAKNADDAIGQLKDANLSLQNQLRNRDHEVTSLRGDVFKSEEENAYLKTEVERHKEVYRLLSAKYEDLSRNFISDTENSNKKFNDVMRVKDDEMMALKGNYDGVAKAREEELATIRESYEGAMKAKDTEIAGLKESYDSLNTRIAEMKENHDHELALTRDVSVDSHSKLEEALSELGAAKRQIEEMNVKLNNTTIANEKTQIEMADVAEQNATLESQLASLQKQNADLKSKLAKGQQDMVEMNTENVTFQQVLSEKDAKLHDLKQQLASLEGTHTTVSEERDALDEALAKRTAKLQECEQQNAELENSIDGYIDINVQLKSERDGLQQNLTRRTERLETAERKNAELERAVDALTEEKDAAIAAKKKLAHVLERTSRSLQDKENGMSQKSVMLDTMQEEKAYLESETERLTSEVKNLKSENDKLKLGIGKNLKQMQEKEATVSKLDAEVDRYLDEIKNLRASNDKLGVTVSKKAKQIADQDAALADKAALVETLEQKAYTLESEVEGYIAKTQALNADVFKLNQSIEKKSAHIQDQETLLSERASAVETLEQKARKLESDLQKQTAKGKGYEERIEEYEIQVETLQDQLEEKELDLTDAEAKVEDVKSKKMEADIMIGMMMEENSELKHVKEEFTKQNQLLVKISDSLSADEIHRLKFVQETDNGEINAIVQKIREMHEDVKEVEGELNDLQALSRKLLIQKQAKYKNNPANNPFKYISRRASFIPTQLPTQVWADETNRPRVADLVRANEALMKKIEHKTHNSTRSGGVNDMLLLYLKRKAFAVWLQCVGSDKLVKELNLVPED